MSCACSEHAFWTCSVYLLVILVCRKVLHHVHVKEGWFQSAALPARGERWSAQQCFWGSVLKCCVVVHSFGVCISQNLFSGNEFTGHVPTSSFYYLSSGSREEAVGSGSKQASYNRGSFTTSLASGRN